MADDGDVKQKEVVEEVSVEKTEAGGNAANKKKKKKKKSKKQQEAEAKEAFQNPIDPNAAMAQIQDSLGSQFEEKKGASHKFWDNQPVLKLEDEVGADENGCLRPDDKIEDLRQEPYSLGDNFEWEDVDITDDDKIQEVYNLLKENYVEDDDNMFRFDYSVEFLQWALKPPGYRSEWHLGIRRAAGNKELVGFITGIPATVRIYEKKMRMVEINFLCVHKRIRKKAMAPHLIREITRRVNMTGIFQAVYTAGIVLPKPVASCRYYHRSLNPLKLIDIRFSPRPKSNVTSSMIQKKYKLPSEPLTPGVRALTKRDVGKACVLLQTYLKQFHISAHFDEQEFAYWFLPREGVINTFVVEDPETKQLTDMLSFYTLPSTIIGHRKYSTLKAAYSFYNVHTKTNIVDLMRDGLICARQLDFDVFNALDIFHNGEFLEPLKFGKGDGHLQYYFYNWKCPPTKPTNMGLVLM